MYDRSSLAELNTTHRAEIRGYFILANGDMCCVLCSANYSSYECPHDTFNQECKQLFDQIYDAVADQFPKPEYSYADGGSGIPVNVLIAYDNACRAEYFAQKNVDLSTDHVQSEIDEQLDVSNVEVLDICENEHNVKNQELFSSSIAVKSVVQLSDVVVNNSGHIDMTNPDEIVESSDVACEWVDTSQFIELTNEVLIVDDATENVIEQWVDITQFFDKEEMTSNLNVKDDVWLSSTMMIKMVQKLELHEPFTSKEMLKNLEIFEGFDLLSF